MKLKSLSANCHQLSCSNGDKILFSYETPVAAYLPDVGFIRTEQKFSVTTSRHVNAWLAGQPAKSVSQSFLNSL